VELDNAIYRQRGTGSILLSTYNFFSSILPQDDGLPAHTNLFTSPESTSLGSSLYTPSFQLDLTEIPIFNLASPAPPPVGAGARDLRNGDAAAHNWNSPPLSNHLLTRVPELPRNQILTALSPTPSLSHSEPSIMSSPSPVSPVDCDAVKVAEEEEEDREYDVLATSPIAHSRRAAGGSRSAPTTKKRGTPAKATSVSRSGAARFPCDVPGCKQVCKTMGDLKRHKSILSHQPPSWKCSRCGYRFTREDALKRHFKNVPKCASAKNGPRGRAASIKLQRSEAVIDVEDA
jgi:hypothetical protein